MPLHLTCSDIIYKEITEILIKKGADVNALDRSMRTPLHYACDHGIIEYVKLLHKNDAEIIKSEPYYDKLMKSRSAETPIDIAKRINNLEIIKYFEENEFGDKSNFSQTQNLFHAISEGNINNIENSIKLLSDININNSNGIPLLHYVITRMTETKSVKTYFRYVSIFILLLK